MQISFEDLAQPILSVAHTPLRCIHCRTLFLLMVEEDGEMFAHCDYGCIQFYPLNEADIGVQAQRLIESKMATFSDPPLKV